MSDPLQHLIDTAAERDQLNRSAWVREILAAAVSSPLSLPEILVALRSDPPAGVNGHRRWNSPNPQLKRKLGATVVARTCIHRTDLIVQFPTFARCSGCGMEWVR